MRVAQFLSLASLIALAAFVFADAYIPISAQSSWMTGEERTRAIVSAAKSGILVLIPAAATYFAGVVVKRLRLFFKKQATGIGTLLFAASIALFVVSIAYSAFLSVLLNSDI